MLTRGHPARKLLLEIHTVAIVKIQILCITTYSKQEILIHLREDIRELLLLMLITTQVVKLKIILEQRTNLSTQIILMLPHLSTMGFRHRTMRIREVSSLSIIRMMRYCWVGSILPRTPSTAGLISR